MAPMCIFINYFVEGERIDKWVDRPCNLLAPSPSTLVRFSRSSPAVTPNFLTKSLAALSRSP